MSRKFPLLDNFNTQPSDGGKYKFGLDSEKISSIKHLKPVFAFDYVCDDNGEFSFCGQLLGASDYKKLVKGLKRISAISYNDLSRDQRFHFHDVEWNDVSVKESDFNKCIFGVAENNGDITPYQFKVYEEARIIGFIYSGVFYLVLFERGHNPYKRK